MNAKTTIRAAFALLTATAAAAQAATYYVNPNSWGDGNSGTSPTFPWKTIDKVNKTVVSGDTVYFFRGGVWGETLQVKSGVTYTDYGSNASKPVITGSRYVGGLSWSRSSVNSNIWMAVTDASIESGAIGQLYLNGVSMTRARTPNVGSGSYAVANSRYARIAADGDDVTLNIAPSVVPAGETVAGATVYARNVNFELSQYKVTGWKSTNALALEHVSILDDWNLSYAYPLRKDYGYWLENKFWMLDSPGEWYFDVANHRLYVWMPNGASPSGQQLFAASQANAIVADNASNFNILNIVVKETMSDGISVKGGSNASLKDIDVINAGRRGISMMNATYGLIRNVTVTSSGKEGIWLGDARGGPTASQPSVNSDVVYSTITDSGKTGFASAGVMLGNGGQFMNNTVTNSPNLGVLALRNTVVKGNLVKNSCTQFDDCGGIYISQPPYDPVKLAAANGTDPWTSVLTSSNLQIVNNIVDGASGSADGVPSGGTDTRGIYLDDFSNNVTVSGNYVTGVKYGLMLHTAWSNKLSDNLVVNNRSHNLLLQEDAVHDVTNQYKNNDLDKDILYTGMLQGNEITHNAFAANKNASAPTLALPNIWQTAEGGTGKTGNFAKYTLNRYATVNPNATSTFAYNYGSDVSPQDMTFAAWQGAGSLQDLQGVFYPYATTAEAWGFYNTPNTTANKQIACISASATPCGPFTDLLAGTSVTLPTTLAPGKAIILIK